MTAGLLADAVLLLHAAFIVGVQPPPKAVGWNNG